MKVRDCLEQLGGVDKVVVEYEPVLDVEVSGMSLITDKGRLFCCCGGEALIQFHKTDGMRGGIFLVRDDHEGEAWANAGKRETGFRHNGARPAAVLRMVISG
jgi:hypothetical protein